MILQNFISVKLRFLPIKLYSSCLNDHNVLFKISRCVVISSRINC